MTEIISIVIQYGRKQFKTKHENNIIF